MLGPSSVGLYRIGPDRVATRCADLRPATAGYLPWQVTLSAGSSPEVCVLWVAKPGPVPDALEYETKRELVCYRGGVGPGWVVSGTGHPVAVALSPNGRSLAWTDSYTNGYVMDIVTASLGTDGVSNLVRIVPVDRARIDSVLREAAMLAWAGDRALAVSVHGQDGEHSGVYLQTLSPAGERPGWMNGSHLVPPSPFPSRGWAYDNVIDADQSTALAVEQRPAWDEPPAVEGTRALRIQIPTGKVLDVVALPGPRRDVTSVSGGPTGIVYSTQPSPDVGSVDAKFYIRFPRQPVGLPILGLPADTAHVVAAG
ncbi:MAG: hypothetical protein M3O32_07125 [Actinomycetota bacterium]|nr:hypothetical protein [Actinomycetota bacterium]